MTRLGWCEDASQEFEEAKFKCEQVRTNGHFESSRWFFVHPNLDIRD